jgi:hypothetical protein
MIDQSLLSILTDKQKSEVRKALMEKILNEIKEVSVTVDPIEIDVCEYIDLADVMYELGEEISNYIACDIRRKIMPHLKGLVSFTLSDKESEDDQREDGY